jgi:hypothetical protein
MSSKRLTILKRHDVLGGFSTVISEETLEKGGKG